MTMDYARKLKEIREILLLSQEELAKELGVTFATVNRWENGHYIPSIKAKRVIRDYCKRKKIKWEE